MSGISINLGFDPASIAAARRMLEFDAFLAASLAHAMPQGLDEVQAKATDYMTGAFINPQGGAENAWEQDVHSPYMGILTNTAAYGQRLHYGFSGMSDSLGRFFPYWPAYHWADHAIELATPGVTTIFHAAVQDAIDEVTR